MKMETSADVAITGIDKKEKQMNTTDKNQIQRTFSLPYPPGFKIAGCEHIQEERKEDEGLIPVGCSNGELFIFNLKKPEIIHGKDGSSTEVQAYALCKEYALAWNEEFLFSVILTIPKPES
jgi:hypothetical protein